MMHCCMLFFVIFQLFLVAHVSADEQHLLLLDATLSDIRKDKAIEHDLRVKKINEVEAELNRLKETEPNSPVLWYVISSVNEARMIVQLDMLGKPYDESIEEYKKQYISTFVRAMELDKTYEPHLTSSMYYRRAWLLPLDLKLDAYHRVLKFEEFGEYPKMRDNVYGNMISALYDAGRYEEAIQLQKEMLEDPRWLAIWRDKKNEVINKVYEKISLFEKKIQERDSNQAAGQATKPKQKTTQPQAIQTKPEQPLNRVTPKTEPESAEANYLIYIIIILLLAIGAVVLLYLRRRGKS